MTTLTIEEAFWRIHYKVDKNLCYETFFLNTAGRVAGIVLLGPIGIFAWEFILCTVKQCYGTETLGDKMLNIATSESKIKEFMLKLSQELGYKDNWRKMYSDIENGVFDLNETSVETM